jgi:hypothetical protein
MRLGEICAAEEKLSDARANYEESLRLRNELQEKGTAAETLVIMAKLPADPGHDSDEVTSLRTALEEFRNQKLIDDEIVAASEVALTSLEAGKPAEAQKELEAVSPLLLKGVSRSAKFDFDLAAARIKAALGRVVEARAELQSALAQATRLKYKSYEYETRLALAEIDKQLGRGAASRAQLQKLEQEARQDNFILIADKAAAALRQ